LNFDNFLLVAKSKVEHPPSAACLIAFFVLQKKFNKKLVCQN
jgi:hypothetical protein